MVNDEVAMDVVHDESDRVKQLERDYHWSVMARRLEHWRVTRYIIFGYIVCRIKNVPRCTLLLIVLNLLKICGTNHHSIQFWFHKRIMLLGVSQVVAISQNDGTNPLR